MQQINSSYVAWRTFFEKHKIDKWTTRRDFLTVSMFVDQSESLMAAIYHDTEALLDSERELRAQRFAHSQQLSRIFILAISISAKLIGFFAFTSTRSSVLKISRSFVLALESEKLASEKVSLVMNQLDLVTNEAPVLLAQFDSDERLQFADASFINWFGLDRQTMNGESFQQILGEERYPANKPFIEKAISGEKISYERSTLKENGVIRLLANRSLSLWD
jgi:PAS domain-containing protein